MKRKQENGLRKGVERKDLIKSLTEEDWDRIRLMKEIEDMNIEPTSKAYQLGIRNDQMYTQFYEKHGLVNAFLFKILRSKALQDRNKTDILKGSTLRKYSTGDEMNVKELEIENLEHQMKIDEGLVRLWQLLFDIHRYVNQLRLDKKVFFTEENYTTLVDEVSENLKKNGLDLLKEKY